METRPFNLDRLLTTVRTRKRAWLGSGVAALAVVLAVGLSLPKRWEATATVKVHNPPFQDITGEFGRVLRVQDRLGTLGPEITSFSFLNRVARELGLGAQYPEHSPEYRRLIDRMRENIRLEVNANTNLIAITYRAESPEAAKNVCERILENYIVSTSGFFQKNTRNAVEFIETELEAARRELQMRQDAVLRYKTEHINELPEVQEAHLRRLEQLRTERQSAQAQLGALHDALELARRKLASLPPVIDAETLVQENADVQALVRRQRELESQLTALLENFTEEHWQVRAVRAELKLLEEQIAQITARQTQTVKQTPNPAWQALQDSITRDELEARKLQTRIDQLDADIAELEAYRARVPQSQLELQRLESERAMAADAVDNLVKRLQQARVTGQLEQTGQGPSFEIIDRPLLPIRPASPRPKRILAAGVAAGVSAAAAVIYLLTVLDPFVRDPIEARALLRMPILGVVETIVTPAEARRRRRRRIRRVFGWSAGLALAAVGLLAGAAQYSEPLARRLAQWGIGWFLR